MSVLAARKLTQSDITSLKIDHDLKHLMQPVIEFLKHNKNKFEMKEAMGEVDDTQLYRDLLQEINHDMSVE